MDKVNGLSRSDYNELARQAGCQYPEDMESDGANWLYTLKQSREEISQGDYDRDSRDQVQHEFADDAVPIYSRVLWTVWVELGGYDHDSDYHEMSSNSESGEFMYRQAQATLYDWAITFMNHQKD